MDLLKKISLFVGIVLFSSNITAQIESGKVENQKQETEKTKDVKKSKEKSQATEILDPKTLIYFGGGFGTSYRTLTVRPDVFGKPLGEKANETSVFTPNFTIGAKLRMVKNLYFDLGVSFAQNGEQYQFLGEDTSYAYVNKFSHFAIPLKLQYIVGGKVKFIAGIGLQPQMMLRYRKEIEWTDAKDRSYTEVVDYDKNVQLFSLTAIANVGIQYSVTKNVALFLLPELRYQLNGTFGKTSPQIHKGYFLGGQIGASFAIN